VTSPLMAAAWVETVMRAELCNAMEAVDGRQQFEQTAVRSGHAASCLCVAAHCTERQNCETGSSQLLIHGQNTQNAAD